MEHCLGQEESNEDMDVFLGMEGEWRGAGDKNDFVLGTQPGRREQRTRWQ